MSEDARETFVAYVCDWYKHIHSCPKNPSCHRPAGHSDRCNTYDPDGHP